MMMRWRMIVRRIACEGASNLVAVVDKGVFSYDRDDRYRTFCDAHGL